jgi:SAM-dependent methyltransferase
MSHDDAAPVDELLAAAYSLDGPEASRSLYARWADTYDSSFITASKYVYHEHVADVFAEHARHGVAPTDRLVDIGCGTGIAGVALRRHAFVEIDGIDISPEMLRQAEAKQYEGTAVYRNLIEADLTQPLAITSGTYAGAVSTGTFTHGHVGPAALAEGRTHPATGRHRRDRYQCRALLGLRLRPDTRRTGGRRTNQRVAIDRRADLRRCPIG